MPICRNIQFDRDAGHVIIVGHDAKAYFADLRVAAILGNLSALELAQLIGRSFVTTKAGQCAGFDQPSQEEAMAGGGGFAGELDDDDFPRPMGVRPPVKKEKRDPRVILDRYGLAVEVRPSPVVPDQLEVLAYPIMQYGAISPEATVVTRWTPEFLDALNRALGTAYTLQTFGIVEVDDGFPF